MKKKIKKKFGLKYHFRVLAELDWLRYDCKICDEITFNRNIKSLCSFHRFTFNITCTVEDNTFRDTSFNKSIQEYEGR